MKTYFFDTYALHEIIAGSDNYKKYQQNIGLITTKMNLFELHFGFLIKEGQEKANLYFELFSDFCIEIRDEDIKAASIFKNEMKPKNISYIDALGYVIAKARGIKFLTGDKEFEKLDNVEFTK